MNLTDKQYKRIVALLPKQCGNVKIDNRTMLDALFYRCKNGCSWRDLPPQFGNWRVAYMLFSRWAKRGVMERAYVALCEDGLGNAGTHALDPTCVKVHPDAFGCLKKRQAGDGKAARRLEHEDTRPCGR